MYKFLPFADDNIMMITRHNCRFHFLKHSSNPARLDQSTISSYLSTPPRSRAISRFFASPVNRVFLHDAPSLYDSSIFSFILSVSLAGLRFWGLGPDTGLADKTHATTFSYSEPSAVTTKQLFPQ